MLVISYFYRAINQFKDYNTKSGHEEVLALRIYNIMSNAVQVVGLMKCLTCLKILCFHDKVLSGKQQDIVYLLSAIISIYLHTSNYQM